MGRGRDLEAYLDILGKVPDREVALCVGLSVLEVQDFRRKHGIALAVGPSRRGPRSKLEEYLDILGRVPDQEVAERAGVSVRKVGGFRRGRGIVIHRSDCPNLLNVLEDPERKVEVEWDVDRDKQFYVRLQLVGEDRKRFLRDVSEAIASSDTNVVSMDMKSEDSMVYGSFLVEVRNLQHLTKVINKIDKVKGVLRIERLDDLDGKEDAGQKSLAL